MKNITKLFLGLILILSASTNAFAQPANDQCAGATSVTPNGSCVAGTNVAATDNWTGTVGCQAGGGNHLDAWYTFVSTGTVYSGTVTASAPWTGNVEFTLVSSVTGCAGPFTVVGSACGASPLAINITGLTNGATYYFTISNPSAGTPGPFQVCSTTSSPAASCVDNEDCSSPAVISYVTGVQTCLTDCNTGAIAGPDFAGNNCQDFPNSTVWYQVTTGASTASINIALTSVAMTVPYFAVFTTSDCLLYTTVNCTQGAAGSAVATVPVAASTTYLIAVSNDAAATGNFDLCITVNNDNSACNTNNALTVSATSMGSPLVGPYQPGEIVSFCYTITDWQQINCNWLQGIVPTFGNCWDPVSFNAQGMPVTITTPLTTQGVMQPCGPGPPCAWSACVGQPSGTWSWFPAGAVTYNAIAGSLPAGTAMPPGWYFLSSYNPATGACTGDPTDPDNSYGDGMWPNCGTNTMDWTVCFQLRALGAIACTNGNTNCAVTINTYADGEIGIWNSVGCTADASGAAAVTSSLCCTPVPTVISPLTYCIGTPAAQLTATGTGLLWYAAATGGVGSATAPTPSTAAIGSINYYVSSTSGGCESGRSIITVTVTPLPVATFSYTGTPYCQNAANPSPTYSGGGVAGTFSASAAGLVFVSTATGQVNLNASTPGTYTVTNTIAATSTCSAVTATSTITITPLPVATFSYTGTPYCKNAANPSPTFSGGGVAGTFSGSSAGLVFVSTATGQVNLSASTAGTYTVTNTIAAAGGCPIVTATSTITITPLPVATFSYTATPYCQNAANPSPTFSGGGVAGTFSASSAGLVFVSTATGQINLSGSTAGSYTVTNTIAAAGGCPAVVATSTITITPLPVATFSYTGTPYCPTGVNPSPTFSGGGVAGTFSASSAGLVFVSTATGQVNLSASTTGTYTVTNTIAAASGCPAVTATSTITINLDNASFSYASSTYCQTGINPTPTITGLAGGTFTSSPAGLSLNSSTGLITLSTSTLATYTITYTTNGACPNSATFNVTITTAPAATFSYAGPYCQGGATNPSPTFSGGGSAGTFTSTAGLLFVSASTGQINLITSTPGTYTVTNTIPAAGGCSSAQATSSVIINPAPVATFSYTGTPYCQNAANPSPTYSGGGVAGTFSASSASLVFVSTATGQVNLSASTAGTYTVTNTIAAAGGCSTVSATSTITITPLPVATFSYTGTPYCQNAANPSPTFSGGGVAGTFSASSAGLVFVSTATGQVNLSGSTAGTYTVTNTIAAASGCPIVTATSTITITPLPVATFSYTGTPYCQNAANPSPTYSGGGVAGTFSASSASLVFVSTATGQVNLSASTAGTYTVTNTIAAASGCPIVTATSTITITPLPVATFSYTGTPYCQNAANPSPTFSGGGVAGTFSASSVGLIFVSTATGQVNLSGSTAGTYTVTNTIAAASGCPIVTATSSIVIDPLQDASFTYSSATYCQTGTNPTPTITGVSGGAFTATPVGISIDGVTGVINLVASTLNIYTITYTTPGPCASSSTFDVTISTAPAAAFSYSGPYCQSGSPDPLPVLGVGSSSGTFSSSPGLILNSTTGQITLTSSTPGTYTVTNTVAAAGGCAAAMDSTTVVIDQPVILSAGNDTTICAGETYTLAGVMGGSATSIIWFSPTGPSFDNSSSLTATYTPLPIDISNGSVILTITSDDPSNSCPSINVGMLLTISPTATVSAGNDTSICSGNTYTLSGVSGGSATSITWTSPTGGTFDNANSSTATYTPSAADILNGSVNLTISTDNPAGACDSVFDVMVLTINPLEDASFNYGGASFCATGADPTPTITGTLGGTFTSTGPITIDPSTGVITLSSTTLGTYTITYTTPGACSDIDSAIVTISTSTSASFSYAGPYCQSSGGSASPTFGATSAAGIFSSLPSGLSLTAATGQIDIGASTPGTYTVYNYVDSVGGCAAALDSTAVSIDQPATANAGVDTAVCAGNIFNTSGSVTGATTLLWSTSGSGLFTDPTLGATVYTPSPADSLAGTVMLILTSGVPAGVCPAVIDTMILAITPLPNAEAGTNQTLGCAPSTAILNGSSTSVGAVFVWTGPGFVSGDSTATPTVNAAGTYTLTVTSGSCSSIDTVQVTLNSNAPDANAGLDQTITCTTTTALLSGSSITSGATFFWTGPGIVSGDSTASATANVAGTYTVTVTDPSNGCSAQDFVDIFSNTTPPDANAGTAGTITCAVTSVNLNGSSLTTGALYSWTGSGIVSGNTSATPTVNVAGTYTLTITDPSNGCTFSSTVVVTGDTAPPIADAGTTQAIGCGISDAILNGSGSSFGINYSYNWTTTVGNIVSGAATTQPLVNLGGLYTLTVTNSANGCIASDTVSVIAGPVPSASFTANPTTGARPLTVDFTNTSQNSNTYFWDFGNGSAGVSTLNASDVYNTSGTYTVTLTASYNSQCPDTAQLTIIVLEDFTIMIPNIFTPNGDANNDLFKVISTGVESLNGTIYDRWGLKIFEWNGVNEGWDGRTSSGVECSDGTYYYILNVKGRDKPEETYKGYVQLIR